MIVNEALASHAAARPPVLDTRMSREATPLGPERTFRIVGVARNSKYLDLKEKLSPVAFMADTQEPAPGYAQIARPFRSCRRRRSRGALTASSAEIDPRITVVYSV